METINMLELRKKIGEIIDRTYYRKDYFVIKRNRKALAAIVPLDDYKLIESLPRYSEGELDKMAKEMVKADRITPGLAKKLGIPYKKTSKKEEKEFREALRSFLRDRYGRE